MTEKKVCLSKAGAAVVAPFAHMQPDAHAHTLKNHLWTHPQEMDLSSGGAEFAAQAHTRIHTHTENACTPIGWRLSTPPQESLRGLLQYSAPGAWKRWSEPFFSPSLLLFLGWISKGPQPPSFSTVFQNTGSQCALLIRHSVPSLQIKTAGL